MVKCLDGGSSIRVIRNTQFRGGKKVFDGMEGSFIMLVSRIVGVGCKEGECGRNIRPCACSKPIYASHHALIAFCLSLLVRIVRGWRGDCIYGKTRAVGSHVRNGIHVVDREAMRHVFGKRSLGKENGEIAIRVMTPGKCCAEEIVHRTHEVYFDFACQELFEQFLLCFIFRVKDEIINVEADVDWFA